MAIGGSMKELGIRGRTFAVTADNDSARKLGGYENEIQANGNGTARVIKTSTPWSLTGIQITVDDDNGDHEFLQEVADDNGVVPITFEYVSGAIYQATGTISGELQFANQSTSCTLDLGGGGKATKQ
jgi:hypothetical protein